MDLLRDFNGADFQTVVTSPPYWRLRNYQVTGQLGLESTPEEYVANLLIVFDQVYRVLRDDGTLWLNLGDSYVRDIRKGQHKPGDSGKQDYIISNGGGLAASGMDTYNTNYKPKNLVGIPWMVAFALQEQGWCLRQDIIWHKPNPMPESVMDRCTKAHEYLFLMTKGEEYYFDHEAMLERCEEPKASSNRISGKQYEHRNRRSVWTIATQPFRGSHFATFPENLVEPCILAGSRRGDLVLDPFSGSGTVGVVCKRNERSFVGLELNKEYVDISQKRIDEA